MSVDPVALQEEEYLFPYHYVSSYMPHFRHFFCDSWAVHYLSTIEFLLSELSKVSFKSIVDVGCGDGRFTQELALRFPGAKVAGVDFSRKAITLAEAMNTTAARFFCADIAEGTNFLSDGGGYLTSNEGRQDAAVLMEVFEHIPPDRAGVFVEGVARLLVPGGLLFVTVPHSNKPVEPKHFRHFTSQSLVSEFSGHFEVLEIKPFERRCLRLKLLQRLLVNRFFILNNGRALDAIYRFYKKSLFEAEEKNCQRLYLKLRRC